MTPASIIGRMTEILADLLGDDSIVLTEATERADVDGWDSFTYVNFIVAVEVEFKVKFRVAEIESFPNIGAIVQAVIARQSQNK